ncbi:MAG: AAA family ATPase [Bacteroidales bacterium]|nr:AAA family ATPase [Bacteroidales bacterium]
MKFTRIRIQKEITQAKGIEEIDIQRLSDVVAFVGKNGSGKTRILDLIEDNLFYDVTAQDIINGTISCAQNLSTLIQNPGVEFLQARIKQLEGPEHKYERRIVKNTLSQVESANSKELPAENILTLRSKYLKRIKDSDIRQLQAEASKEQKITFETLMEKTAENFDYDELGLIRENALKYLKDLTYQLAFDEDECNKNEKKLEKRKSYRRYKSLKKFVFDLLKKDLTWARKTIKYTTTSEGYYAPVYSTQWTLDGRDFNYVEFSEGEKMLFSYALLFFLLDQNPNLNIRESIILIDEPELHLHPDSEIDLIEGLRNVIKDKGQLIIATHSINILSMLNYDEIFMVQNGVITHPSQETPGKSLSELMGIEQRVNKLTDFLSSISTWSFVNFITQCFSDPDIMADSKQNDPQIESFKKAVKEKANKNSNILLDFGAGKGRVYKQLKSDSKFINSINYCALEPDGNCQATLKELGVTNIYSTYTELPQNSFDFILLCNVLHEISVIDWEKNLNTVMRSLKSDGYLIIIEPKMLTKGEKIGKIGYLLLDLEEIKELFNLTSLPIYDDREDIICAVIDKKTKLYPISDNNIKEALKKLEERTFEEIIKIREKEWSKDQLYAIGRKMAFLSQQYINTKIAQYHLFPYIKEGSTPLSILLPSSNNQLKSNKSLFKQKL